jgi:hypothetical protein
MKMHEEMFKVGAYAKWVLIAAAFIAMSYFSVLIGVGQESANQAAFRSGLMVAAVVSVVMTQRKFGGRNAAILGAVLLALAVFAEDGLVGILDLVKLLLAVGAVLLFILFLADIPNRK